MIRVAHRGEVLRLAAPPDWEEWGYCSDCAADAGQPCYDVLGTTTAQRFTTRLNPHMGRVPAGVSDA